MSAEEGGLSPATSTPVSADEKLREQLLDRHRSNAEQRFKEIEIPGQHGLLVARYHRVPWEVSEAAAHTIKTGRAGAVLDTMLDLLHAACEEILVRRGDGSLIPVADVFPELGAGPTRYGAALARAFNPDKEFEGGDRYMRAAVLAMFPSEQAVAPHAAELQRWLDFSDEGESEDFSQR